MKIGEVLKGIRLNRNLKLKEASQGIINFSQLSRIENQGQIPSVSTLFALLDHYNVTCDEFLSLVQENDTSSRYRLEKMIDETLRTRDTIKITHLSNLLEALHQRNSSTYLIHYHAIAKAYLLLNEEKITSSLEVVEVLKPVTDYLNTVDHWYRYDLKLLNGILFAYEYEEAMAIGRNALHGLHDRLNDFEDMGLYKSFLGNMAVLALDHGHPEEAYKYISTSLSMVNPTKYLFTTIRHSILHQIICFQLGNSQYKPDEIPQMLNIFKLMNFPDVSKELRSYALKHGLPLEGAE